MNSKKIHRRHDLDILVNIDDEFEYVSPSCMEEILNLLLEKTDVEWGDRDEGHSFSAAISISELKKHFKINSENISILRDSINDFNDIYYDIDDEVDMEDVISSGLDANINGPTGYLTYDNYNLCMRNGYIELSGDVYFDEADYDSDMRAEMSGYDD